MIGENEQANRTSAAAIAQVIRPSGNRPLGFCRVSLPRKSGAATERGEPVSDSGLPRD